MFANNANLVILLYINMPKFEVNVKVTDYGYITVEADNKEDAEQKAKLETADLADWVDRGELEILHVIQHYLDSKDLKFVNLGDSFNWFDAGNPDSMLEVSTFAAQKDDVSFGSVETAAFESKTIDKSQMVKLVASMPTCMYKAKLEAYIKALDE